jgi:hypothetical protein
MITLTLQREETQFQRGRNYSSKPEAQRQGFHTSCLATHPNSPDTEMSKGEVTGHMVQAPQLWGKT